MQFQTGKRKKKKLADEYVTLFIKIDFYGTFTELLQSVRQHKPTHFNSSDSETSQKTMIHAAYQIYTSFQCTIVKNMTSNDIESSVISFRSFLAAIISGF